jgi:hypothetical protein
MKESEIKLLVILDLIGGKLNQKNLINLGITSELALKSLEQRGYIEPYKNTYKTILSDCPEHFSKDTKYDNFKLEIDYSENGYLMDMFLWYDDWYISYVNANRKSNLYMFWVWNKKTEILSQMSVPINKENTRILENINKSPANP